MGNGKLWEINAKIIESTFGGYVDWEERFYNCPECGEPIYECDWTEKELLELCPICGFTDEDDGFTDEDEEEDNEE